VDKLKTKFNVQWNLGSTYAVRMTKNIAILLLALEDIFTLLIMKIRFRGLLFFCPTFPAKAILPM